MTNDRVQLKNVRMSALLKREGGRTIVRAIVQRSTCALTSADAERPDDRLVDLWTIVRVINSASQGWTATPTLSTLARGGAR